MSVQDAIRRADAILPGPCAECDDTRWQAVIAVGDYVETEPEAIWVFVTRWGGNSLEDLRDAVATVLLEHLLEYHFELIFPRVEAATRDNPLFADMFRRCWKFGQSKLPANAKLFNGLQARSDQRADDVRS